VRTGCRAANPRVEGKSCATPLRWYRSPGVCSSLLCAGMPEARWVEPERFHLTLRFIGAVDDAMAHDITAALQRIEASPFALTLAGGPLSRTQPVGWRGAEPSCGHFSATMATFGPSHSRSGSSAASRASEETAVLSIGTSPITRWLGTRPDSDAVRGASGQRPWRSHKKDAVA
jgi:hypothetical protein